MSQSDTGLRVRAAVLGEYAQPMTVMDLQPAHRDEHTAIVEVLMAGLCHTDVSLAQGRIRRRVPLVLGHELVGRRIDAPGAEGSASGRVVVTPYPPGHLVARRAPRSGRASDIQVLPTLATAAGDPVHAFAQVGAFADHIVIDERRLVPIDDDVPDQVAAMIGCAATTGVNAVYDTAAVPAGATVVVLGLGGVGTVVLMACCARGARVVGVDPSAAKRDLACSLGAVAAFHPDHAELADALDECLGAPIDYVFEVVGTPRTQQQAVDLTRPGGCAVLVGSPPEDATVTFNASSLVGNERVIRGHANLGQDPASAVQRVADLYRAGMLPLDRIPFTIVGLAGINDAVAALDDGALVKVLVRP